MSCILKQARLLFNSSFICSVPISEPIDSFIRLGWLIRFISHSVISGFTTSSAIVIALSQAKYFLGYDVDGSSKIIPVVTSIINGFDKVRPCLMLLLNLEPIYLHLITLVYYIGV